MRWKSIAHAWMYWAFQNGWMDGSLTQQVVAKFLQPGFWLSGFSLHILLKLSVNLESFAVGLKGQICLDSLLLHYSSSSLCFVPRVFFMRKFDMSGASANIVSSIVYFISTFASPIMGNIVDRTGRNIVWLFVAVLLTLFCHAMLAFTFISPYVPMVSSVNAYLQYLKFPGLFHRFL